METTNSQSMIESEGNLETNEGGKVARKDSIRKSVDFHYTSMKTTTNKNSLICIKDGSAIKIKSDGIKIFPLSALPVSSSALQGKVQVNSLTTSKQQKFSLLNINGVVVPVSLPVEETESSASSHISSGSRAQIVSEIKFPSVSASASNNQLTGLEVVTNDTVSTQSSLQNNTKSHIDTSAGKADQVKKFLSGNKVSSSLLNSVGVQEEPTTPLGTRCSRETLNGGNEDKINGGCHVAGKEYSMSSLGALQGETFPQQIIEPTPKDMPQELKTSKVAESIVRKKALRDRNPTLEEAPLTDERINKGKMVSSRDQTFTSNDSPKSMDRNKVSIKILHEKMT